MKLSRKIIVAAGIIGLLGTISLTAFASSNQWSPAETLARLTGRTTQDISEERASGKHYGTIAKDAGQLEEFQREAATAQRELYAELVKEGKVPQEEADAAIAAADQQRAICDGTGQSNNNVCGDCDLGYCPTHGVGNSGQGNHNGGGYGHNNGHGNGNGHGGGRRARDGSCVN